MRIFRYAPARAVARIAVAPAGGSPVDLLDAWNAVTGERRDEQSMPASTSSRALIDSGPAVWNDIARVAEEAVRSSSVDPIDFDGPGIRMLPPLDRLASLRDFLAFEDHVERGAARRQAEVPAYWYDAPVYYKGNHRSILGPEDDVTWPRYTDALDFELEMAMIVGLKGRDVPADAAGDLIFGFTIMNDWSARDIQAREISAWLGPAKGKDFATSLGPCIVTADDLGSAPDLAMVCRVNGEEWGRARSSDLYWSWTEMIAHVSNEEDVFPGDVYGSGTPGGCCGLDLGRTLQPGDVVELEIEELGVLRNRVVRRPT